MIEVDSFFYNTFKINEVIFNKTNILRLMWTKCNFQKQNEKIVDEEDHFELFMSKMELSSFPILAGSLIYLICSDDPSNKIILYDKYLYYKSPIVYQVEGKTILTWRHLAYYLDPTNNDVVLIGKTLKDIAEKEYINVINRHKLYAELAGTVSRNTDDTDNITPADQQILMDQWKYFYDYFTEDNSIQSQNITDDDIGRDLDEILQISYLNKNDLISLTNEHIRIMIKYGYKQLDKLGMIMINKLSEVLRIIPEVIYNVDYFNYSTFPLILKPITISGRLLYVIANDNDNLTKFLFIEENNLFKSSGFKLPNPPPLNIVPSDLVPLTILEELELLSKYQVSTIHAIQAEVI